MRVGLKRSLLAERKSCRPRFAASHELGHVRQVLQGQTPARVFTWDLYWQEMGASGFAAIVLAQSKCQGAGWWYKSWLKHFLCAMQAAFPVLFHGVAAVVLWVVFFLLGRLTGLVNWLADLLAPLLASRADLADIQAGE